MRPARREVVQVDHMIHRRQAGRFLGRRQIVHAEPVVRIRASQQPRKRVAAFLRNDVRHHPCRFLIGARTACLDAHFLHVRRVPAQELAALQLPRPYDGVAINPNRRIARAATVYRDGQLGGTARQRADVRRHTRSQHGHRLRPPTRCGQDVDEVPFNNALL